jgi:hypothetical protein
VAAPELVVVGAPVLLLLLLLDGAAVVAASVVAGAGAGDAPPPPCPSLKSAQFRNTSGYPSSVLPVMYVHCSVHGLAWVHDRVLARLASSTSLSV